jgi:hypothetical protein
MLDPDIFSELEKTDRVYIALGTIGCLTLAGSLAVIAYWVFF